jgi:hypothetical protein
MHDEIGTIDKKDFDKINKLLRKNLKIKKKYIHFLITPFGKNWVYDWYFKNKKYTIISMG